jgi:hypothetical protein
MPKFLAPIDLNKSELRNAVVQNLAAAPGTPAGGQIYTNTAGGAGNYTLQFHNGTAFVSLGTGSGSGTVTSVSVVTANGLAGTVATASSTPAITLSTTVTGLLRGNGTAISAATGADLPALNTITAPTAALSLNAQRIIDLATPTTATDATTKAYVDAAIQGLVQKPTATVATAAALPASTYANGTSGVGATLTATANGALTVDGYAVAAGDLVLVKNQASALQNGLYGVTQPGTAGTPFILTRDPDMDTAAEFSGAFIPVEDAGTANANTLWLCTNTADPTVGTTAIVFTQLNGATALIAGAGITISGNTVSVATTYAGGTSIATVGTITAGTWNGTAVAVLYGGTGATTAAGARTNLGATGKYSALVGDAAATAIAITQATHGLAANGQMVAQVFDAGTGAQVFPDVAINNANGTVTFTFATAPAANAYRVVIEG